VGAGQPRLLQDRRASRAPRERVSARHAEALGLVTKVVAPDKLAAEAETLSQSLLSRSAASLQGIKEYLKFASRMDPASASAFSSILNAGISSSQRRDPPHK